MYRFPSTTGFLALWRHPGKKNTYRNGYAAENAQIELCGKIVRDTVSYTWKICSAQHRVTCACTIPPRRRSRHRSRRFASAVERITTRTLHKDAEKRNLEDSDNARAMEPYKIRKANNYRLRQVGDPVLKKS